MTNTMSIRVDETTRREIDELAKDGQSRNSAIVEAIHEAYRHTMYAEMRRVSLELRDDPEYQAEIRAAQNDMGSGNAW